MKKANPATGLNPSGKPALTRNSTLIALALLLAGLTFFAYARHFNNPFQYDDGFAIVTNPYIRSLHNIPLFFKDAATSCSYAPNQIYRPLNTTLNAIDCWLGGKTVPVPFYYHVSIFISFLLLGIFIYLLARKIYDKALSNPLNPYIALLTTAVFMLHTANAETVNYIYERSDLVSTLMVLVALCVFIYFKKLRKYQLYIIPVLLGMLVKEPAAVAVPLVFLYLFLFEEQMGLNQVFAFSKEIKLFIQVLPALVLVAAVFVYEQKMTPVRWSAQGHFTGSNLPEESLLPYLQTQCFAMVHYFNNFIFPFNLTADSDWSRITNPFDDRVVVGLFIILLTLYAAYKASLKPQGRPVTFGILWFYLALAPTSSIFPQPEVIIDHRAFFAFIGLTLAVVWGLFLLYAKHETTINSRPVLRYGILLFVLCFLAAHVYGVRQRCKVWSSEESLWHDTALKSPGNGRALMYYGKVLMAKGDYNGALHNFTRAKQVWPYYTYTYINLGVLYNTLGKAAETEQNFKYALQLDPNNPDCYSYYATALLGKGDIAGARALVSDGLKFAPQNDMLNTLYKQLAAMPVIASSKVAVFEQAIRQNPTADNYIGLSVAYYNEGRYTECINAAKEALKLKPGYDMGYNNICSAYNALHDWDKAIEAGKKALAINPGSELIKNNLQIALDGKKNAK